MEVREQKVNPNIYRRFFESPTATGQVLSGRVDLKTIYLRFFLDEDAPISSDWQYASGDQSQAVMPAEGRVEARLVEDSEQPQSEEGQLVDVGSAMAEVEVETRSSWVKRVRVGLSKTRKNFSANLATLIAGKKKIDADLLEEIETQLLVADVGVEATNRIVQSLTEKLSRSQLKDAQGLYGALKEEMRSIIDIQTSNPLEQLSSMRPGTPFVILVIGVNGVGKTTTIGKLANRFKSQGLSVMLAAGDTFRAAAVEQLKVWGERNEIPVVAQHTGADSASVIFDAVTAAKARAVDVLIADTAGRLHTKSNLMSELEKVKRVIGKVDATAPHEILLVLDAGTGQNALAQAQQFHESVNVSGVVLTKLDGTAKGGILFAICQKLGLPLRYIGVGEQANDLRPFVAEDFISALFDADMD